LKQLINFIDSKNVAIPEFQRGFVWKNAQVKKLFDSLINQYPIGSFILWETNKKIDARALNGEPQTKKRFLILDGQQRMVSLYYLCRQKKFVEPHIKDRFHQACDNKERDIIDFEKFNINKDKEGFYLDYFKENSCKFDFKKFQKLVKNGYKFPVVIISLDDYRKAIEVFERINQAGTRISTESVFLSETWNTHSNIAKILRNWKKDKENSLTRGIDTVIFIHVFAIILQLDQKKDFNIDIGINALKKIAEQIRESENNKYDKIFEKTVNSVARAVQYLKEEYKIISLADLPSQTMITILSIFFYYNSQSQNTIQTKELKKWFWRSSLSNRYIGSGYSQNINIDAKKMKDLALKNNSLEIPISTNKLFSKTQGVDIKAGRSTYRNIFKQALWQQKPIFIDGRFINRIDVESGQHKPEDDHFFPYNWSRKGLIDNEINNILNIHFLNKNENIRKSDEKPSKWLSEEIKILGVKKSNVIKYFESQLLPFKNVQDVKRYEKAFDMKGDKRKKEFTRMYKRFLWKRFKLFEKVLIKLQNGN